jgi:hypothetical protein
MAARVENITCLTNLRHTEQMKETLNMPQPMLENPEITYFSRCIDLFITVIRYTTINEG